MIESVQFRNFRVLRDTTLPLSRFTLLLGPNGSGKSTALQALENVQKRLSGSGGWARFEQVVTTGVAMSEATEVEVLLRWSAPCAGMTTQIVWSQSYPGSMVKHVNSEGEGPSPQDRELLSAILAGIRVYSLDATRDSGWSTARTKYRVESRGCISGWGFRSTPGRCAGAIRSIERGVGAMVARI